MINHATTTQQKGFGAIMAIIVIVILAGLAAALAKISSAGHITSAQDIQGARAAAAAKAGIEWGVYGLPETFIIDKQGRIRYRHVGPITEQDLAQVIRPMLKSLN